MKRHCLFFSALLFAISTVPSQSLLADAPTGKLIFEDAFDRTESDAAKEDVGNDWVTNSKARAKGEKQVWVKDGVMTIKRAAVADHGVSVVQNLKFKDATIQMRFKLGAKDSLGINIADMKEKSVHAGHICLALVKPNKVEIADLKTGRMNLKIRTRRKAGEETDEDKKLLKKKSKYFPVELDTDNWHTLNVQIKSDTMTVSINDNQVGQFKSPGIGHETKSRIRLAVAKSAMVDDIKVWQQ